MILRRTTVTARIGASEPEQLSFEWVPYCGAVSTVLFTGSWLMLGAVRPGYSQLRQPISDLGIGREAVWTNASFVANGLLLLCGALATAFGLSAGECCAVWASP